MKAYIRKIRYIHQGPTSAIGWQVYINDLNSNPLVLKEFIVEDQALTYLTNFNNAAGDNMNIEKELRRNVRELQDQLQRAYGRIKTLQDEIHNQRKREYYNDYFSNKGKGMSGWAMMEEPPEYLEEGHKEFEYPIDKTENDV
tara:strand:- start:162 stop:587 length:426 start_codon:yes stop_codon:yes gene_type:complete